jgi:hypothetical protein
MPARPLSSPDNPPYDLARISVKGNPAVLIGLFVEEVELAAASLRKHHGFPEIKTEDGARAGIVALVRAILHKSAS